jgi:hypothetical protein
MSPAARPPPWVVHLLARDDEHVRPLCGDWRKSPNWTTEPTVVTCPECAARVSGGTGPAEPRPSGPPAVCPE